ncbi:unnamed protein product, partial [Diamesa hyperborea]
TLKSVREIISKTLIIFNVEALNIMSALEYSDYEFSELASNDSSGIDPLSHILGKNLISNGFRSIQEISCGIQSFAAILVALPPAPCNYGIILTNISPVISLQARYGINVLLLISREITSSVNNVEEFMRGTGIDCTTICTLSRELAGSFSSIALILSNHVNNSSKDRLVAIFDVSTTIELNSMLSRTTQFLECIRANVDCGINSIKSGGNQPFNQLIASLNNESITELQYQNNVREKFQITSKQTKYFVENVFSTLRLNRDLISIQLETTRHSLSNQIQLAVKTFNDKILQFFQTIPFGTSFALKNKLNDIPFCLRMFINNWAVQSNHFYITMENKINTSYQNASAIVNGMQLNLTNFITSLAPNNCQVQYLFFNQVWQSVFEIKAAKCIENTVSKYQEVFQNCTANATNIIAKLFNEITAGIDKCICLNVGSKTYHILPAGSPISHCLIPSIQRADFFCTTSNSHGSQCINIQIQPSLAYAQVCLNDIVTRSLSDGQLIAQSYKNCTNGAQVSTNDFIMQLLQTNKKL